MTQKIFIAVFGMIITGNVFAQRPTKQDHADSSFAEEDYEALFNELDALLDSMTAPKSFVLFNIGMGRHFFNYQSKSSFLLEPVRKTTYTPSLAYFAKNGLGLSASAVLVKEEKNLNPYQFYTTASYDYMKRANLLTGIAYTRFFTKDSLPFYTSPLQNEVYAYFTYKKSWFKPSVAVSYGWGSRSAFEKRENI